MKLYHRDFSCRHLNLARALGACLATAAKASIFAAFLVTATAAAVAPVGAGEAETGPVKGGGPARPVRLVSLVPALTETLFALGAGPRVVGVSDACDHPPAVEDLPRVGTFLSPVVEVVIKLAPDLVLTSPSPGNEVAVRAIERAGITVAVVDNEGSIEASKRAFTAVAKAVGMEEAGRSLVDRIEGELREAAADAGHGPSPKIAVVVGREPLVLAGSGSYLGQMVELVGATNVAAGLEGRWPRASLEYLLSSRPQILVDLSMGSEADSGPDALERRWGRFSDLPAVAAGRLYQDPSSLFLRPGPRLGEAALALAAMVRDGGEAASR